MHNLNALNAALNVVKNQLVVVCNELNTIPGVDAVALAKLVNCKDGIIAGIDEAYGKLTSQEMDSSSRGKRGGASLEAQRLDYLGQLEIIKQIMNNDISNYLKSAADMVGEGHWDLEQYLVEFGVKNES
ncbi:hypothetical protein GNI_044390 [Gregarina niphandrodes]|uniref:Uncharacterized protein n=1 Tax=Gregarina niphandrodes TaxID=110365 RepID=A0A023BA18_GRENI|nr:hypothetical protein GNI_044390 [Gregarina niphandrodes]EZG76619.1 hypothetical protein GNI_044390 [Gregarina niphandrodes]|eukprot:XP_011129562.1 hypothetical protein GNI_044390 [Gregarina niphandrodes]